MTTLWAERRKLLESRQERREQLHGELGEIRLKKLKQQLESFARDEVRFEYHYIVLNGN